MVDQINLISGDLDGADLRREQHKNKYHARCDGENDSYWEQEAVKRLGTTQVFIPAETWQRIFGDKK